ncbi:response regulator [Megalodesulfovibrio paquesii]
MSAAVRVFLVDDHPAVRQGLALLLRQSGCEICGEAGCHAEALTGLQAAGADVVVVDLSLGGESGLELLDALQALPHEPPLRTLVYSMHEDAGAVERAFGRGAHGYVTKREVAGVLLEAIAEVLAGRRYVSPVAARTMASRMLAPEATGGALSQREEEILAMLGRGDSSAEIARALHISVRTVETYYSRIMEKMDIAGMKELRKQAIRLHLESADRL